MEKQLDLEAREFPTRGDRFDQKYMTTDSSEDPYCVCVHVLCEAGEAGRLQAASNQLLSLLRPELQLLRVSERGGAYRPRPKHRQPPHSDRPHPPQPSLALILFLHEDSAHYSPQGPHGNLLCRHPWIYHHTERVQNPHISPHTPSSQDFYTLAPGTPLWAVRAVHYGKEVLRLTVYCRYHSYGAMVRLYRLLVGKRKMTPKHQEGFTCWVLYNTTHTQVQLSLKRLPRDQSPVAMESALLEFRVPDVGGLIPLLPHACHPISSLRWQTHDYDNNKILLQSPVRWSRRHTLLHIPSSAEDYEVSMVTARDHASCPSAAAVIGRGPASYRHRRYQRSSTTPRGRTQTLPPPHRPRPQSHQPLLQDHHQSRDPQLWEDHQSHEPQREWVWRRSRSLPAPPTFRLNVSALVGAMETDVDTGRRMSSSCLDLSVVSGYSLRPRPSSHGSQSQSHTLPRALRTQTHDHSTHTHTHTPPHTAATHTKHVQNTHTAAHHNTHTHTPAHTQHTHSTHTQHTPAHTQHTHTPAQTQHTHTPAHTQHTHTSTHTQHTHTPAHTQHTHTPAHTQHTHTSTHTQHTHTPAHTQHTHTPAQTQHTQHTHTPTQSAEHRQHTPAHTHAEHTHSHTHSHTPAQTAEHTHSPEDPEEEEQEFYI